MSDEFNTGKMTKLIPLLQRQPGRTYVKGADQQGHVPGFNDVHKMGQNQSFKNVLTQYVDQVNTLQHDADAQIQRLVAGETENLHEVMIAMDEAETSFQMMMEIRNKLVDAYKDLSRMQG